MSTETSRPIFATSFPRSTRRWWRERGALAALALAAGCNAILGTQPADEPTCSDGVKNSEETDLDCGGNCAPAKLCGKGQACGKAGDCTSGVCTGGVCQEPTCSDGARNGSETGMDCGGPACPACENGKPCTLSSDCTGMLCAGGICAIADCVDGLKDGSETDVDCGGGCAASGKLCAVGHGCLVAVDCASGMCTNGKCVATSCTDGVKNGTETDVDCGGGGGELCGSGCKGCSNGKICTAGSDCASGSCQGGTCAPWSKVLGGGAARAVTMSDCGNIYVGGEFTLQDAQNSYNVVKYPSGCAGNTCKPDWKFPNVGGIYSTTLYKDSIVYAAGEYVSDKTDIDNCHLKGIYNPASGLLVALDAATGKCLWGTTFVNLCPEAGSCGSKVRINDLVTDAAGDVYVAGEFDVLDVDLGIDAHAPPNHKTIKNVSEPGTNGSFVAKIQGTEPHYVEWARSFGASVGGGPVFSRESIALLSSPDQSPDKLIIGGGSGNPVDFGSGMSLLGGHGFVLALRSDNGDTAWIRDITTIEGISGSVYGIAIKNGMPTFVATSTSGAAVTAGTLNADGTQYGVLDMPIVNDSNKNGSSKIVVNNNDFLVSWCSSPTLNPEANSFNELFHLTGIRPDAMGTNLITTWQKDFGPIDNPGDINWCPPVAVGALNRNVVVAGNFRDSALSVAGMILQNPGSPGDSAAFLVSLERRSG